MKDPAGPFTLLSDCSSLTGLCLRRNSGLYVECSLRLLETLRDVDETLEGLPPASIMEGVGKTHDGLTHDTGIHIRKHGLADSEAGSRISEEPRFEEPVGLQADIGVRVVQEQLADFQTHAFVSLSEIVDRLAECIERRSSVFENDLEHSEHLDDLGRPLALKKVERGGLPPVTLGLSHFFTHVRSSLW